MAITTDDFNKIWASTSPLTPYSFSESQYKEGWNFIGSTPPSRQMWDFLQKNNDEKMQYLSNNFDNYLPLSGGNITGDLSVTGTITGNVTGNADTATNATNDANGNPIAGTYLPLSGGTLTGAINTANATWNKLGDDACFGDRNVAGKMCIKTQTSSNTGIAFFNQSDTNVGQVEVNNAFDFNKPVKENGGFLVPIGVVQAFAGKTTPQGWLLCDGSAVSRTDYAALYAVIGTTYGTGNGSTTFNLPNLTDKFIQGNATAGTVKSAGLPNITGSINLVNYPDSVVTNGDGALGHSAQSSSDYTGFNAFQRPSTKITFDASRSSAIYGNSTTVQPPALTMRYIIKY